MAPLQKVTRRSILTQMHDGRPRPRFDVWVVAAATFVGSAATIYLATRGMHNLYGDGIAHLNIARKVVDARDAGLWERYVQLGSPWLPLPHLVMLPFVWVDRLWRSGLAGTIPSLAAYVASVWLAYRGGYEIHRDGQEARDPSAERSALLAAVVVALNPSVLYMAATPMTELLFVALLLATVYATLVWARAGGSSTKWLALSAAAAAAVTLTRYEGWSLLPAGAAVVALCSARGGWNRLRDVAAWSAIAAVGPLYWMWHNWAIYGDALEFLRGPYSARSIFAAQASRLGWASFVVGNPAAALGWALVTVAVAAGPVVVALAVAGLAVFVVRRRRDPRVLAPALLAIVPFAFVVFSLFRGEVQIYPLAAVALLNVRYGVPYVAAAALLLPALAMRRRAVAAALAAVVALQYGVLLSEGFSQLAVYQEALRNSHNARPWRDRARLAEWLRQNPPSGLVLMHGGELGAVVLASGLEYRDVVHEGTREWNEWLATGALPEGVSTVVTREGDAAWRMREDPAFVERFEMVYRTGESPALEVWRARALHP